MRVTAVITTHNEAASITSLITMCRLTCDDVVVIDEGSTDGTRYLAVEAGAWVRSHSGGIGPCQRQGWKYALLRGADRIVQIDAGGSHDAGEIPYMLKEPADVVIGSRYLAGSVNHNKWWRRVGSEVYAWMWDWRTGAHHTDWTSGYRVFSREAAQYLMGCSYMASMHGWQAECLAWAEQAGFEIAEYPIAYEGGKSSLSRSVVREAMKGWWAWER